MPRVTLTLILTRTLAPTLTKHLNLRCTLSNEHQCLPGSAQEGGQAALRFAVQRLAAQPGELRAVRSRAREVSAANTQRTDMHVMGDTRNGCEGRTSVPHLILKRRSTCRELWYRAVLGVASHLGIACAVPSHRRAQRGEPGAWLPAFLETTHSMYSLHCAAPSSCQRAFVIGSKHLVAAPAHRAGLVEWSP